MADKNITLHPLRPDGTIDTSSKLYPKTTISQVNGLQDALNTKQNTLTAGTNITITDNVISATSGQTYTAGTGLTLTNNVFAVNTDTIATKTDLSGKQDTLTSGTNIKTINGNSILGQGDIQIGGGGTTVTGVTPISVSANGEVSVGYDDSTIKMNNDNKLYACDLSGDYTVGTRKLTFVGINPITTQTFTHELYANQATVHFKSNSVDALTFASDKLYPTTDNSFDLGASSYRFKNLYLSNDLSDGTNSVSIANIATKSEINGFFHKDGSDVLTGNLKIGSDNSYLSQTNSNLSITFNEGTGDGADISSSVVGNEPQLNYYAHGGHYFDGEVHATQLTLGTNQYVQTTDGGVKVNFYSGTDYDVKIWANGVDNELNYKAESHVFEGDVYIGSNTVATEEVVDKTVAELTVSDLVNSRKIYMHIVAGSRASYSDVMIRKSANGDIKAYYINDSGALEELSSDAQIHLLMRN